MKKLFYRSIIGAILAVATAATSIPAAPQTHRSQPAQPPAKSIDPAILQQLQNIKPIDRRKIKPGVIEKIAQDASSRMSDVSITTENSKTVIPELTGLPESIVIVVSGKTKHPFSISSPMTGRGTTYPPGLKNEAVYSDSGKLLRDRTTLPNPKIPTAAN